MTLLISLLAGLGVTFVIAAVVLGREARRLDALPPTPTFDLNEAVLWVSERLPDDVTAELSYDDVRRILDLHLDDLRERGMSVNGKVPVNVVPVVVGDRDSVRYVLTRAAEDGHTYRAGDVHAVLDAQLGYFRTIGAVGPPADEDREDRLGDD